MSREKVFISSADNLNGIWWIPCIVAVYSVFQYGGQVSCVHYSYGSVILTRAVPNRRLALFGRIQNNIWIKPTSTQLIPGIVTSHHDIAGLPWY